MTHHHRKNPTRTVLVILFLAVTWLHADGAAAAPTVAKLRPAQVIDFRGSLCGEVGKLRWAGVEKVGKRGRRYRIVNLRDPVCGYLSNKKPIKRFDFSKLPVLHTIVNSSERSGVRVTDAGMPPTLADISSSDVKPIFWRSNVVQAVADGVSTASQCSEFATPNLQDQSAGLYACYMAEGLGELFNSLVAASGTACLMSGLPTASNVRDGTLSVTVPASNRQQKSLQQYLQNVTKLFTLLPLDQPPKLQFINGIPFEPPLEATRTVRLDFKNAPPAAIEALGDTAFVKVSNQPSSFALDSSTWMCRNGVLIETGTQLVQRGGGYSSFDTSRLDGAFPVSTFVEGFIAQGANADGVFDGGLASVTVNGGGYSASLQLDGVTSNVNDAHYFTGTIVDGAENFHFRGDYVGDGANNVRLLEGAVSAVIPGQPFSLPSSFVYQTDRYISVPSNDFTSILGFTAIRATEASTRPVKTAQSLDNSACAITPDVIVTVDLSTVSAVNLLNLCVTVDLAETDFCHDDLQVKSAAAKYASDPFRCASTMCDVS